MPPLDTLSADLLMIAAVLAAGLGIAAFAAGYAVRAVLAHRARPCCCSSCWPSTQPVGDGSDNPTPQGGGGWGPPPTLR